MVVKVSRRTFGQPGAREHAHAFEETIRQRLPEKGRVTPLVILEGELFDARAPNFYGAPELCRIARRIWDETRFSNYVWTLLDIPEL
jgi:hypothetical protein